MTDYSSIRADQHAVKAAREAKHEGETWGEYLLRCADADVPRKWTKAELESLIATEIESYRQ